VLLVAHRPAAAAVADRVVAVAWAALPGRPAPVAAVIAAAPGEDAA